MLRHAKVTLRPPATLPRRLANTRRHQAFDLEAFQRGVHTAEVNLSPALHPELPSQRNPIRLVSKLKDRQQNHQLELADKRLLPHIFHIQEEIHACKITPL